MICSSPLASSKTGRGRSVSRGDGRGLDPKRVVTFGSSMGGGNALAAGALDGEVAAAISQVPFLDSSVRPIAPGQTCAPGCCWRPRSAASYLPAVGQPHEAAFINAPDSEAGWRHVVAIGEDSRWRNRVSSRWLLGRPYNPGRHAKRCTVRGWSASAEPIRSPTPAPRSPPQDGRRMASYGSTPAWTISTSTTGPSMTRSSPISSNFSTATSWPGAGVR